MFPTSLCALQRLLVGLSFSNVVELCRSWGLLLTYGVCKHCQTSTRLRTPYTDQPNDSTRWTSCSNPMCHNRRMHFKYGSTFAKIRASLTTSLLVIMCFSVMLNPAKTRLLIGNTLSKWTVKKTNKLIRKHIQHSNKQTFRKLGGASLQAQTPQQQRSAVLPGETLARFPVEVDEGMSRWSCMHPCYVLHVIE